MHSLAGKLAGGVSLLAFIPYLIRTLQGKNRPNRATWIIWTILGFILLASYRAVGASDTLWVSVANCVFFLAVVSLSFHYGEGGWTQLDMTCLLGAALGLFLWWYLKSPLSAVLICILLDFLGALPTLKKAYKDPKGEDRLTWLLFLLANLINLFAINQWTFAIAAYPIYLVLICLLISLTLWLVNHKNF